MTCVAQRQMRCPDAGATGSPFAPGSSDRVNRYIIAAINVCTGLSCAVAIFPVTVA